MPGKKSTYGCMSKTRPPAFADGPLIFTTIDQKLVKLHAYFSLMLWKCDRSSRLKTTDGNSY